MARITHRQAAPDGMRYDPNAGAAIMAHASHNMQIELDDGTTSTGRIIDATVVNDGTYLTVTIETETPFMGAL